MKPYNGFSSEERTMGGNLLKKMFQVKGNTKKNQCCLCKQVGVPTHTHMENYYEFYNYQELCIPCHINLHSRWRDISNWLVYTQLVISGAIEVARGSTVYSNVMVYWGSADYKAYFQLGKRYEVQNRLLVDATAEQLFLRGLPQGTVDYRNSQLDIYGEDYLARVTEEVYRKKNIAIFDKIILK